MDIDLYLNPQDASDRTAAEVWNGCLELAWTADRVGFDHLSAGQHYLSDFTQLQLLPFLSRLTGEVHEMEISTGIILLPLHHPVDIAERIATFDTLHDGHTVFGVGAGYRDIEFKAFDVPKSERVSRLKESLKLTKRLLSEERVSHRGNHYTFEDVSIPVRPDDITVWMAANSNSAVERAARLTDGWMVNPHSTISEIRDQKDDYYDPIRNEQNTENSLPIIRETFVAPTHEQAVDVARDHLWEKYQTYIDWGQDEAMEDQKDLHQPFDDLAEDRFLLGTPAEVCEEIERYERNLDVSHIIFRCHWPSLPYERTKECIERIGDEVIPNV